ncbi:unnamed protein product [Ilex paraguariensis]|uniref:NAC domain-containing protein n=1 Tax=Ilex paraguariensis TaxID=185542 RepID=A0ABC8V3E2_9AQUA
MASMLLPPGFRFHPTDVELVMYYLKRKVMGKKLHFEVISELNINKFFPWELPDKSCLRSKDREWYFFCPRERKYASGSRMNRATENGYWKATGQDKQVLYNEQTVGKVKTLIFHKGHAPRGERTNWVIHEYRLEDKILADAAIVQDAYVLCKVFKKNRLGPNNGAQYGAPFNEEEWNDDEDISAESLLSDGSTLLVPDKQKNAVVTSTIVPGSTYSWSLSEPGPSSAVPSATKVPVEVPDDDYIDSWLAMFTEDSVPIENDNNEVSNMLFVLDQLN